MGALPEGYTPPKSSGNYMKLIQGVNKFRILSKIIVGWETWVEEDGKRKPVRAKDRADIPMPNGDERLKFFWAMVVWNYIDKQVQILEITQASIRKALEELEANEDWGDLRGYDITVKREGEGMDTVYSVIPSPKKVIDQEVLAQAKATPINLDALYSGGNPFEVTNELTDEEIEDISSEMDKAEKKKKGSKGDVIIDPDDLPF